MCHGPQPSHPSWFDHPNTGQRPQVKKLLVMHFF
jgi:hypothetical protein